MRNDAWHRCARLLFACGHYHAVIIPNWRFFSRIITPFIVSKFRRGWKTDNVLLRLSLEMGA
jgi:hypothetical protein